MALIQIKRSDTTSIPSQLGGGELAHSEKSKKLFVGNIAEDKNIEIGGELFVSISKELSGNFTSEGFIDNERAVRVKDYIRPWGYDQNGDVIFVDVELPTLVENIKATGTFRQAHITYDKANYQGHSYTEILRNTSDDSTGANVIGSDKGQYFIDTFENTDISLGGSTFYYFLRHVNQDGISGLVNTSGISVTLIQDNEKVMLDIGQQITDSNLHNSLTTRLDKIDLPTTGLVDKLSAAQSDVDQAKLDIITAQSGVDNNSLAIIYLENNSTVGAVSANTNAISALNTRVDTTDGNVTANALSITNIESTVNNATTGVSVTASGLTALTTRVVATESGLTSQATKVDQISARTEQSNENLNDPTASMTAFSSKIVMENGVVVVGVYLSETEIFVNGTKQGTYTAGTVVEYTLVKGDVISTNAMPISANAKNLGYSLPSYCAAGYTFVFNTDYSDLCKLSFYSPFSSANVKWTRNSTDFSNNISSSVSDNGYVNISQNSVVTVTTATTSAGTIRIKSSSPILVFTQSNYNAKQLNVFPSSKEVLADTSYDNYRSSLDGSVVNNYNGFYTSDSPLGITGYDNVGTALNMGLPYSMCGDRYLIQHKISGYSLVAIEPCIIEVLDAVTNAILSTHDLSLGDRSNPMKILVGSATTGSNSTAALFSNKKVIFRGSAPFYVRTNDEASKEYTPNGYRIGLQARNEPNRQLVDSAISTLSKALTNDDLASASTVQQHFVDYNGMKGAVEILTGVTADSFGTVTAKHSIVANANGVMTGISLVSRSGQTTTETISEIVMQSDKLIVVESGFDISTATAQQFADRTPFLISGGITYIKKANIKSADILDLVTGKITSDHIVAGSIIVDDLQTDFINAMVGKFGKLTVGHIAANAITVDKLLVSGSSRSINVNPTFEFGLDKWTNSSVLSNPTISDAPIGTKIMRITSLSSGSDDIFSEKISIEQNKTYRISVWVRQPSGNQQNYLTVRAYNSAGVNDNTGYQGFAAGTYLYWSIVNAKFPTIWTKYEIIVGLNAPVYKFPTTAKSISIGGLFGRAINDTTVIEISNYQIEEMIDGVLIEDGAVSAQKINVVDLFAQDIVAKGKITGATLQTATTGNRVVISNSSTPIEVWDQNDSRVFYVDNIGKLFFNGSIANDSIDNAWFLTADGIANLRDRLGLLPPASPTGGTISYTGSKSLLTGDFQITNDSVFSGGAVITLSIQGSGSYSYTTLSTPNLLTYIPTVSIQFQIRTSLNNSTWGGWVNEGNLKSVVGKRTSRLVDFGGEDGQLNYYDVTDSISVNTTEPVGTIDGTYYQVRAIITKTDGYNETFYGANSDLTSFIADEPTSAAVAAHNHEWSTDIQNKPTTLSGYGITDISVSNVVNKAVIRNSSGSIYVGYVFGSYFNGSNTFSTSGDTSAMGMFTGTRGTDTYGRSYTAAAARTLLNVYTKSEGDVRYAYKAGTTTQDFSVKNINVTSGDGNGIKFWGSTSYRIFMSTKAGSGTTELNSTADYNMTFEMTGIHRGFVFYNSSNSSTASFQITGAGDAYARLSLRAPTFYENGVSLSTKYLGKTAKANDSNLLDGLDLHTGRNNGINKVVRTDASGYLQTGWINTTSGASTTGTLFPCFNNTGDMYLRYMTATNTRTQLSVYSKAESNSLYGESGSANTWSGTQTFSSSITANSGIKSGSTSEFDYGIHGGYGNSNGSGGTWGASIWGMGTSYDGGHAGTAYTRPNYGICWLRSGMTSQGYSSTAGEGLYVASQNAMRGAIGHLGIWTVGNIVLGATKALYFDGVNGANGAGGYGSNTYIQENTADNLRIVTGGGERFNANSSGIQVIGAITSTGTVTGSDIIWSSDERIKTHIRIIKNASVIRRGWTGNTYIKDGINTGGLLAQQVLKNFRQGVTIDKDTNVLDNDGNKLDELLQLNISPILGVIVESANEDYKELTDKINEQQKQINKLIKLVEGLI